MQDGTESQPGGPWPANARFGDGGLMMAGIPAAELAREHGTPLFLVDEEDVRARCRGFARAFPRAMYAVKAFTARAIVRIALEEGLGLLAPRAPGSLKPACARARIPRRSHCTGTTSPTRSSSSPSGRGSGS